MSASSGIEARTDSHAERFHALHHAAAPLLLANAWDVASAVVVESAGASAIATTSAGVAWSLGCADGERLGRERAVELVDRVVRAVELPVTVDIEGGFGDDDAGVAETVRGVVGCGAVGINIEDVSPPGESALRTTSDQVSRLTAARAAADAAGVRLFINARVDTYLRGVGEPSTRLEETVARAEAYLAAGADGIFVPGLIDLATLAALVARIPAPLNVLVGPGAPTVTELAGLGVRRVSLGSSVAAAAYAVAARAMREITASGTYESVRAELDYGELNQLVTRVNRG